MGEQFSIDFAEWRTIPGWPAYQASSDGRIRRADNWRIVSQWRKRTWRKWDVPYWSVSLTLPAYARVGRRKRNKSMHVHRLVCLAFNGEPPEALMDAHHVDEDYDNNAASNLEWQASVEHRAAHNQAA